MEKKHRENNRLEKSTFFLGLLVLIALVAYLVLQWTQRENQPPRLMIATQQQRSISKTNTFKVTVENKGHQTAEAANIKFELYKDSTVAGTAVLQISFIPEQSKKTGWVIFPATEESADSIVVSSISYIKP